MTRYGRLLGVDVGSKRVGLARTDLLRTSANPMGTYSQKESIKKIENEISDGQIIGIVVGWPLTPQGARTHTTELVENYINRLKNMFKGIDIFAFDERYSSREASRILVHSGISKKKRMQKGRIDQAAAAHILQQYLEANPDL